METTIGFRGLYRGYIGIMEKKMEADHYSITQSIYVYIHIYVYMEGATAWRACFLE